MVETATVFRDAALALRHLSAVGVSDDALLTATGLLAEASRLLEGANLELDAETVDRSRRELGLTGLAARRGSRTAGRLIEHLTGTGPTVLVTVTKTDLDSETGAGTSTGTGFAISPSTTVPLPASVARQAACTGTTRQVVFDTNGNPVAITDPRRTFTDKQRQMMIVRDGTTCIVDGCTIPAYACEAHHIHRHENDGPTDITNGALLCWHHHRMLDHDHTEKNEPRPRSDMPDWLVTPCLGACRYGR